MSFSVYITEEGRAVGLLTGRGGGVAFLELSPELSPEPELELESVGCGESRGSDDGFDRAFTEALLKISFSGILESSESLFFKSATGSATDSATGSAKHSVELFAELSTELLSDL